ncbi:MULTISPECIES: ATP-grasp domain-containing protein [Bacillaceae]|uniref:Carbamoyl phosphate synthase large subunit n=1 Tax=Gottfriedia luciferensis TaxID=178774 RepID=A0ABX3A238_9BACI|nr:MULTISPECIES: ATP-grasp domain-containing protein [Bacillaceae]ODG93378.1 carbamoyl phosphate synthase large subunit [Gottfriedia luciferensis]PGZ88759.1 carbamoyl phosphate synthase large subunit [Bacillus sp. AFS029533]SFC48767.1 ATP-grasp domain-containing protein [Bacillus sp. UNCCL81]
MNYILISPFYPENFQAFAHRLKAAGVNVLGIGEEPYDQLGSKLQNSLTEYYRVNNLEDLDEVKRAVAFLFYKHGPIDRIESNNEYWLELDAQLREQFNVYGNKPSDLKKVKYKSEMKKLFKKAGVPVVDGKVVKTKNDLTKAIDELGLPVIAKPDNGVGSAATFKLCSEEAVRHFEEVWDEEQVYFIEPYVEGGVLCTFDGLVDQKGNIVFQTSFTYNVPTLELVKGQLDLAYVIQKEIDPRLETYGKAIVKAFGMKERFFHIEFFKLEDGGYVALEYNNRLAGGYTIDMYNFAYSIDLFAQYASIVTGEKIKESDIENQYCVGITQRDAYEYNHDTNAIYEQFGDRVKFEKRIPDAFAELQGNQFYAINADSQEEVDDIIRFVHERKNCSIVNV